MEIIAALFMDDIETRSVPGPSTRIDLGGIQFSAPAPAPVPCTIAPHLVVIVWAPAVDSASGGDPASADPAFGVLEVVFRHADASPDDPPVARNVQPLTIEPGKFNYRLVRADLAFDAYSTIVAYCRIDQGPVRLVPYTLLPPVA